MWYTDILPSRPHVRTQRKTMDSKKKMVVDELDPQKVLSLNLSFLKIGGIWWRDIKGNPLKVLLYRCYEKFVILIHMCFDITTFLHAVLADENFADFSESLLVCVCQALHGTKLIPVLLRREKMTRLTVTLEKNFYIHGNNLNNEEKSIIKNAMYLAKTITFLYFGSLCTTTFIMILTPPTLALTSGQFNSTIQRGYNLLIWKAWFPVDPTVYPYNILTYLFQVSSTISEGCFIIGGLNAFYLVLIIYTTSQFELLSSSLRNAINIKEDSTDNKDSSGAVTARAAEDIKIQHPFSGRGSEDDALHLTKEEELKVSRYMKECINYHQHILE
jgi:hypothetical protein